MSLFIFYTNLHSSYTPLRYVILVYLQCKSQNYICNLRTYNVKTYRLFFGEKYGAIDIATPKKIYFFIT